MLKLLQTGDLHLGKIFYEHSLIEDQKQVLDQIIQELKTEFNKNEPYNALVITGDIYDRAVAPAEAITLFDSFLVSTHTSFPELAICIISGNHDSAKRMSFATSLLEAQNIHICTRAEDCVKPILLYNKTKSPVAALYQLPFLYAGDFTSSEGNALHNQSDLVTEAVRLIQTTHKDLQKSRPEFADLPALLNAHLNTLPESIATTEETPTINNTMSMVHAAIGTAGYVSPTIFSFFDYVALGHIHKPIAPAQNAQYAGSPLETSFKNTGKNLPAQQKHFLRVELDTEDTSQTLFTEHVLNITKIPIKPLHPVLRLLGTFSEFENGTFSGMKQYNFTQKDLANAYLEITCTDTTLVENPLARLQKKYPLTMAINQEALKNIDSQQSFKQRNELFEDSIDLEKIDNAKLFSAFVTDIFTKYTESEWKDAKKLFLETLQ
jgi:exonuclease SbcD